MLVTLSARIGATRALPPVANAEPDERVTRMDGLSAQFMAARGEREKRKKKTKVEMWTRLVGVFFFSLDARLILGEQKCKKKT